MPSCQHCTEPDHDPTDCANRHVPMIHRTCTCRCDREECDPAPYWTHHNRENP